MVPVTEGSQVSEARRVAAVLGSELELDKTALGNLAIVVTEAATNLVKHAQGGEIHLRTCQKDGRSGIEVLALDRGPGIAQVQDCLRDGYSTRDTSGTGLGAILRLSGEFDVYSQPGKGTCLVSRVYDSASRPAAKDHLAVGAVQVPVRGERQCGDNWGFRAENGRVVMLVADGLGHGPDAAEASKEAVGVLGKSSELAPVAVLERVHQALRGTRGAAVAVAHIEPLQKQVRFAGVGNISASIVTPSGAQHMVSHNGTAGHNVRKLQEFVYAWPPNGILVMHSDGITTSWRLDPYPRLMDHDPSLLAAVLYRDASRGRDDACVVVARAAS